MLAIEQQMASDMLSDADTAVLEEDFTDFVLDVWEGQNDKEEDCDE